MTANPMPMPNRAVMIGRPMAMTEPNATSRMMMAAKMPMASLDPGVANTALLMGWPPNSTSRPGGVAALAVSMTFCTCDADRSPV